MAAWPSRLRFVCVLFGTADFALPGYEIDPRPRSATGDASGMPRVTTTLPMHT